MKNFYLIYGAERSFVNNELSKLIDKLNIGEVIKYDMQVSSISSVVEDALTVGLFTSNKIIILDDCFFLSANKTIDDIEMLEEYIDKYNPDNY